MSNEEQILLSVMVLVAGISVAAWVALGNVLKLLEQSSRTLALANLIFGCGIFFLVDSANDPSPVLLFASDFCLLLSVWLFRSGVVSLLRPISEGVSPVLGSIRIARKYAALSLPLIIGVMLLSYLYAIRNFDFWRIVIFSIVASWEMGYCFYESVKVLMNRDEDKQKKSAWLVSGPFGLTAGLMLGMGLFAMMGGYADGSARAGNVEFEIFLWVMLSLVMALNISIGGLCAGRLVEKMIALSERDHLSGAFSRQSIEKKFEMEIERSKRTGESMSCVFLDIDHFKNVNDTYGHEAGDVAIKYLARTVERTVRTMDWVGRYGGEEFVVVMANTGKSGGIDAAERIRKALEGGSFNFKGQSLKLTASLGVTCYVDGEPLQSMLSRADEAMYAAKKGGRNKVEYIGG